MLLTGGGSHSYYGEVVLSASLSGGGAFLHYEGMAEVPGHVPGITGRTV